MSKRGALGLTSDDPGYEQAPYRVEVLATGETNWAGNALRFNTVEEAVEYMRDLYSRWMAAEKLRVVDDAGNVLATYPEERSAAASGAGVCARCGRPLTDTTDVICTSCARELETANWEGDIEDVKAAKKRHPSSYKKRALHEPIAYTYEADYHCPSCALERFGRCEDGHVACQGGPDHEPVEDDEGNPVGVVAPWDEWWEPSIQECQALACSDCGNIIDVHHDESCRRAGGTEPCPFDGVTASKAASNLAYWAFIYPDRTWEVHHDTENGVRRTRNDQNKRASSSVRRLAKKVDDYVSGGGWFHGYPQEIWDRVAKGQALLDEVRRARSTAGAEVLDDAEARLTAAIETLKRSAQEYDRSYEEEFLQNLPGGTVAIDYGRLIDGGLVDIGPDDGSWLYAEAARVQKEAAAYDWDAFATVEAERWVAEKAAENPEMLRHEVTTRMAAVDYARNKTMVLLDPAKRAAVIDAFVTTVERHRRKVAQELAKRERIERFERVKKDASQAKAVDRILDDHGLMWW